MAQICTESPKGNVIYVDFTEDKKVTVDDHLSLDKKLPAGWVINSRCSAICPDCESNGVGCRVKELAAHLLKK